MKKLIIFITLISTLFLVGCSSSESKLLRSYNINAPNYLGEVDRYTLTEEHMVNSSKLPYKILWGLQSVSYKDYLNKEIICYGYTSDDPNGKSNNQLEKFVVMTCNGEEIGGYSMPYKLPEYYLSTNIKNLNRENIIKVKEANYRKWAMDFSALRTGYTLDYFINDIKGSNIKYSINPATPLTPNSKAYKINLLNDFIIVGEYNSILDMEQAFSILSPESHNLGTDDLTPSPPNYYSAGKLIIKYTGNNTGILNFLSSLFY
ncbi:MAG: hypothetical protein RR840_06495 [Clostridium sp.]